MRTTETTAGAAVAAANSNGSQEAVDAELFTQELLAKMGEGVEPDKITQGMDKLNAKFPDRSITSYEFGSTAGMSTYFIELDDKTTININPQVISAMVDDEVLFDKVTDMISRLFSAGEEQNLAKVGGSEEKTSRHVTLDLAETRYVEVQRDDRGRALSLLSLVLQTEQIVSDALDVMLGNRNTGSSRSWDFSFLDENSRGNSSNSGSGTSWGFGSLVTSTTSWQIEGSISMQGLTSLNEEFLEQLPKRETGMTQLDSILVQWEVEAEGEVDLFTYMQMMGLCDPLVFDLADEGINLTSAEDGVYFDIKGDGSPVKTGWISGNNAFLYLDENGNGVADDISELFGDFGGYANGFEKLKEYDSNGDGVIDENDDIYHQLRLWVDRNGDGINQADESLSLADAGITSINLNYNKNNMQKDEHGNVIGEQSTFTRKDGSQGTIADAWFKYLQ